jgi:hypothetical protein
MRLPSIIRLPKYQRFGVQPRYYDPVKEDIARRERNIRENVEGPKEGIFKYQAQIRGAFARKREQEDFMSLMIRFGIFIFFIFLIFGYIYFGPDALYAIALIIPLYIVFRLKSLFNQP